jgi:hypothetical protein
MWEFGRSDMQLECDHKWWIDDPKYVRKFGDEWQRRYGVEGHGRCTRGVSFPDIGEIRKPIMSKL